jgi:hypothetical protein
VRARIETPGGICPNNGREAKFLQFGLQERADRFRAFFLAATFRMTRGPFIYAHKDVTLKSGHWISPVK